MSRLIKIGVVDDHKLFRSGIVNLIESLDPNYQVSIEANNGRAFLDLLEKDQSLDVLLLDANMPIMDGFETAEIMQKSYPDIRILIISMNDDEESIVRMLRLGVKGYIGKDVEPAELKEAIEAIMNKGFYYTDQLTGKLIKSIQSPSAEQSLHSKLTDQELAFVQLACSEYTYVQIADMMCLSPKTIDGYRASVFEKFNLKSRVGLAIYAIKIGLVEV
jgi:two-component system invasion response regulator UvrY